MASSRFLAFGAVILAAVVCGVLALGRDPHWAAPLTLLVPLSVLGVYDLVQRRHAILRNYPILGHFRFLLEAVRPEIRQYFIEGERDALPFAHDERALAYKRAKNNNDAHPFGTVLDVNEPGYAWLSHSIRPTSIAAHDFRVTVGGPDCSQPYSLSVYNISGTSFGAVSANAIMAFNRGARIGGFAHDTGEGSISPYHRRHGGDIIWQIASGYFGCRTPEGKFDPQRFREQAVNPQVKMIEVKLSQGAKPGHGGVLPKAKLTAEIAATRGVPMGQDCVSPARHSAFSSPLELLAFIKTLRVLADSKPVGLKMAVGHRCEVLALIKAMLETDTTPDFIVVDGGEGGTGAAPQELSDHVGMPLLDGLTFMHNALIGVGLRDRIRLGASGKLLSAFDLSRAFALGADYAMAARAFMFAIGCIQARSCHTNLCPAGIATQDAVRQRAIDVEEKSQRVANFHRNTLHALSELLGSAGLSSPADLKPWHLHIRHRSGRTLSGEACYGTVAPGALLSGEVDDEIAREWARAQASSFEPVG